jgi:hypothetical protein
MPKFPFRSLSRWELTFLFFFLMPAVFVAGVCVGLYAR